MKEKNVPIVLIGNKNDLNNERKIQFKDAKNLVKNGELIILKLVLKII